MRRTLLASATLVLIASCVKEAERDGDAKATSSRPARLVTAGIGPPAAGSPWNRPGPRLYLDGGDASNRFTGGDKVDGVAVDDGGAIVLLDRSTNERIAAVGSTRWKQDANTVSARIVFHTTVPAEFAIEEYEHFSITKDGEPFESGTTLEPGRHVFEVRVSLQ